MKLDNVNDDKSGVYVALTSLRDLADPDKGKEYFFQQAIPIDDMCEIAQKVNHDIVRGIHPENENLEAAVIAHTLSCEVCREVFLQESKDAKQKRTAPLE